MSEVEPNFVMQTTPESPKAKFQIPPVPPLDLSRQRRRHANRRVLDAIEAAIAPRDRAIIIAKGTILQEELNKLKERRSNPKPPA